jgi:hypothetical protein
VFSEIESRADDLAYIGPKLETIRTSGVGTWAEMGWLDRQPPVPCVILAQGDRDALEALVLVKLAAGKISRLDLCAVPSPRSARRTGEYPGCDGPGG